MSVIHHEQQVLPTKVNSSSPYYFHRAGILLVQSGCIGVSSPKIIAPVDVNEARDGLIAHCAANLLYLLTPRSPFILFLDPTYTGLIRSFSIKTGRLSRVPCINFEGARQEQAELCVSSDSLTRTVYKPTIDLSNYVITRLLVIRYDSGLNEVNRCNYKSIALK